MQLGSTPRICPFSHKNCAAGPECPAVQIAIHVCPWVTPSQSVAHGTAANDVDGVGAEHFLGLQLGTEATARKFPSFAHWKLEAGTTVVDSKPYLHVTWQDSPAVAPMQLLTLSR